MAGNFVPKADKQGTLGTPTERWDKVYAGEGIFDNFSNVENTKDADKPISDATQAALDGKEPSLPTGAVTSYLAGTKVFRDLATDVRAVSLTGLSTAVNAAITAADSFLDALGKLQAQINASNTSTQTALGLKEDKSNKGIANGYAALDVNGKVPLTQLSDALLGNLSYQGVWNASTNSPNLTSIAPKGHYWIVSAAGTQFSIQFDVGDWIVSNGTSYDKVDNTDAVTTVAGRIGNVVLTRLDVGLSNVDNTSDVNKPVSTATQTALNAKAPLASPALSGTPTAPTAAQTVDNTQIATTAFVHLNNLFKISANGDITPK